MDCLKKLLVCLLLVAFVVPSNLFSFIESANAATNQTLTQKSASDLVVDKHSSINIGKDGELLDKRTRFSKTYLKSGGHKEMVTSLTPLHYQLDKNGKKVWENIDSSLILTDKSSFAGERVYKNKANSFGVELSENLLDKGVSISLDDSKLTLKPQRTRSETTPATSAIDNVVLGTIKDSSRTVIATNSISNSDANSLLEYTYTSTNFIFISKHNKTIKSTLF